MTQEQAPQYGGFSDEQQAKVNKFFRYINDPNQVLVQGSREILDPLNDEDWSVALANRDVVKERFAHLKRDFARDIFARGLYATADGNASSILVSEKDGVFIGSVVIGGRMLMTISKSQGEAPGYTEICFKCADNDPTTLHVSNYTGKFGELEELVAKAAERFRDLKTAMSVMKPDTAIFGGVSLGVEAKTASRGATKQP